MPRYEVRIDGIESSQSFTLDELLDNGFLDDYDPQIQVRAIGEARWQTARDYPYNETENGGGFVINEDGSVKRVERKKTNPKVGGGNFHVNEDGTVSRQMPTPPPTTTPPQRPTSSSYSPPSSNSSNNSGCASEIFGWIIYIAIGAVVALILSNC